jgi:uncharacterized Zn finger protein
VIEKIKCDSCNTEFVPTKQQIKEIKKAADDGTERFIVKCQNCYSIVFVHPLILLGLSIERPDEIEENRIFHCPVSACIGFVEEDADAKVFGCSECGTEWNAIIKVYADIESIIKKYPYRKKVYLKLSDKWESIPFDETPSNYFDKVQREKV